MGINLSFAMALTTRPRRDRLVCNILASAMELHGYAAFDYVRADIAWLDDRWQGNERVGH